MARIDLSGRQIPTLSKLNIDGEFTLDAASGTSGQVLISAGSGNTPTWTSSLTSLTGLTVTGTTALTGATSVTASSVGAGTGVSHSITAGTTTAGSATGGSISLTAGAATNAATITSGGSINITAGAGNSTQGAGGSVTINGGLGSVANGNGTVNIGTGTGTDQVIIGKTAGTVDIRGPLAGTLTLLTGTASLAPIKFIAGTSLTTPVYGAVEASTDAIYLTNNPGSTSTGPGRGIVHPQQMVFSQANASAGPSTGSVTVSAFAAANDVLSVLEAAKLYRFRAKYFISTSFSSGIYNMALLFTFSNAPASIKYSFKTYTQTVGTTIKAMGSGTSTTLDPLNGTQSASGTWVVEVDGYFTSHATLTSTLTPQVQINPSAGGNNGATVQAGSWFEIEKLGTSTQTLIAGNWA